MADASNVPQDEPTATEVGRLRERIGELEAELVRIRSGTRGHERGPDQDRDRLADSVKETSDRASDELNRLTRAIALASAEQLRLAGEALTVFAEEIGRRSSEGPGTAGDMPANLSSGLLKAIDRSLEMPAKTIDKLSEGYRRTPKS